MALVSAEKVALLALVYRDLSSPCTGLGGQSLLTKMAADRLSELDAYIVDTMGRFDELAQLAVLLSEFDLLRYEALLHAWPPGPNDDPPPDEGFDRALFTPERREEVEDAMEEIYKTGITHSRDFVNVVAEEAYAAGLAAQAEPHT
jgi:hypothetical protein